MNEFKQIGKKIFTMSVVGMTMAWSVGLSALVPAGVAAATCPDLAAGTLFKAKGTSSVYVLTSDMKRMYFPNAEVFSTWYKDFTGTVTIEPSCTDAYPNAGGVNFRPGSRLVGTPISPSRYAIGPNNTKMKIADEKTATALYGANWGKLVRLLPDVFDGNLTVGAELSAAKLTDGQLVMKSGDTNVYYVWGGMTKLVTGDLPAFLKADVRTVSAEVFASVPMDTASVTAATIYGNPTQKAGGATTPGTTPATGGALSVGLDANTPAAALLPNSTAFNPVLKFTLKNNGTSDLNVTGVKLQKSGFAGNTALDGIMVVDQDGVQHGNTVSSLTADSEANMLFSATPIVLKAGATQAVTIKVNTGNVTSGDFKLAVKEVTTKEGATVSGLPVAGNSFTMTNGSSSVASTTVGLVFDYVNTSVNLGSTAVDAMKLKVNLTNSTEDVMVDSIMLYNAGTAADTDFTVSLYDKTGAAIFSDVNPVNRYVTFNLAGKNVKVEKGNNYSFSVKVNVKSGASRNIRLELQENDDIMLRGVTTGAYVLPTAVNAGVADTSFPLGDSVSLLSIASGSLSLSESGTPTTNVAAGESNVILGSFKVKPIGEDMELRKMRVGIIQTGGYALTGTVYVKVNGATVYSVAASSLTTTSSASFASDGAVGSAITMSSYASLAADKDATVEIVGSIDSSATSGNKYGAAIDVTEVKRVSTNDITDPSTALVQSSGRTVSAAALTITNVNFTAGTYNVVKSTNQATLAKFTMDAKASGENIRVNSLVFTDTTGAAAALTDLTNLKLYEEGKTDALLTSNSLATLSSSSTITFTLKDAIIVKKGEAPRTFYVKADISSSASAGSTNTHQFTVTNTSDIVGTDTSASADTVNGTAQTVVIAAGGTLNVQVSYLSGHTYTETTTVVQGSSQSQFTVFKFRAYDEDLRITDLTLAATGTLKYTDFSNISLYKNDETSPFATAAQFAGASTAPKTYTFSSSDNLFTVPAGQDVYVRVKTDIAGQGSATLGDTLAFQIATTTSITAKGKSTLSATSITLGTQVSNVKQIMPFTATVVGMTPSDGSSQTLTIGAGSVLGKFKVTNNGSAPITLGSNLRITDSGTNSTTSLVYELYKSDANTDNVSGSAVSTSLKSSSVLAFDASSITVQPGQFIVLTVKVGSTGATGLASGNTFQLSIAAIGDVTYSVTEANLGYDGTANGSSADTISSLYVTGKPSLGTLSKT